MRNQSAASRMKAIAMPSDARTRNRLSRKEMQPAWLKRASNGLCRMQGEGDTALQNARRAYPDRLSVVEVRAGEIPWRRPTWPTRRSYQSAVKMTSSCSRITPGAPGQREKRSRMGRPEALAMPTAHWPMATASVQSGDGNSQSAVHGLHRGTSAAPLPLIRDRFLPVCKTNRVVNQIDKALPIGSAMGRALSIWPLKLTL